MQKMPFSDLLANQPSSESLKILKDYFFAEEEKAQHRLSRAKELLQANFQRHSFVSSSDSESVDNTPTLEKQTDDTTSLTNLSHKISPVIIPQKRHAFPVHTDLSYQDSVKFDKNRMDSTGFSAENNINNETLRENLVLPDSSEDSFFDGKTASKKEEPKGFSKFIRPSADEKWSYKPVAADELDEESRFIVNVGDRANTTAPGKFKWIQSLIHLKRNLKASEVDNTQDDTPHRSDTFRSGTDSYTAPPIENTAQVMNIPVKAATKAFIDFSDVRCIREITVETNTPIRCISISTDCRWLATGTESGYLALWKFPKANKEGSGSACNGVEEPLKDESAATNQNMEWFIGANPTVKLVGHTASIIQLVWSPNSQLSRGQRLLSASMDSTVRLWHPETSSDPLAVLHSSTFPTGVCFHPTMPDTLFVGSLDCTLEVWKLVPNLRPPATKTVNRKYGNNPLYKSTRMYNVVMAEHAQLTDLVTSLSVSPKGGTLAVGYNGGTVAFYNSSTLSLLSEVDCKNRRGKDARGRKVTGVVWKRDCSELCITTNDSRIRILDAKDLSYIAKFKGHVNSTTLLCAEFTANEQHIVCGSENGFIFVWRIDNSPLPSINPKFHKTHKRPPTNISFEAIKAFPSTLTCLATGGPALASLILSYMSVYESPSQLIDTATHSVTASATIKRGSTGLGSEDLQRNGKHQMKEPVKSSFNLYPGELLQASRPAELADTVKNGVSPGAWFNGNKLCIVKKPTPMWRQELHRSSCKDVVFFAGNASGTLRILINIGDPIRK